MQSGYGVFRKLENGQELLVGWRKYFCEAQQFADSRAEDWPALYVIHEIEQCSPHRDKKLAERHHFMREMLV